MCISEARVRDLWNIVEMFVEPFRILCVKRATFLPFTTYSSSKIFSNVFAFVFSVYVKKNSQEL